MREAKKKAEMDVQIAQEKIKELEAEVKNLQGALRQVEFDLVLTLKKKKEVERRTEEHIQDVKALPLRNSRHHLPSLRRWLERLRYSRHMRNTVTAMWPSTRRFFIRLTKKAGSTVKSR